MAIQCFFRADDSVRVRCVVLLGCCDQLNQDGRERLLLLNFALLRMTAFLTLECEGWPMLNSGRVDSLVWVSKRRASCKDCIFTI